MLNLKVKFCFNKKIRKLSWSHRHPHSLFSFITKFSNIFAKRVEDVYFSNNKYNDDEQPLRYDHEPTET